MADTIQLRGDTAANWTSNNPTPRARELCVETDTRKIKIGDGTTAWTSLNYIVVTGATLADGDYGDVTVSGTGTVITIDNDVVTYAKMQNVSATDKVLGRSTAGAGDVEEITCTAFGRSLIDDAAASNARTTLGVVIGTDVQAYDAELAALASTTSAADKVPYYTGSGTATTADFTATGRSIVDDASVSAVRTTIGVTQACVRTVGATINGAGAVISASTKTVTIWIPFAGTIVKWRVTGTVSGVAATGSCVIDAWKTTFSTTTVPTVANTITASAKPTISSATAAESSTLTGWTTSVTAGDQIVFNVDSNSVFTEIQIALEITTTT